MKYNVETIVKFVISFALALVLICGTPLKTDLPLWADLFIRSLGAVSMFLIGFGVGFGVGFDGGADNE